MATLDGTRFEDQGDSDPNNDYYLIDQPLIFTGTVDAGSSNVILTLKAANGDTVFTHTLTQGNGNEELQADGNWTYDASAVAALATANGEMFTLEVTATDKAANTGTTTFTNVKIDATAPPVPSVSEFSFAPPDSKWRHDIAVLGYIGDVFIKTDADATVSAWRYADPQTKIDEQLATNLGGGLFQWTPRVDSNNDGVVDATDGTISLATHYYALTFSLAAVDDAGNAILKGSGPNAVPAEVKVIYGSHAVLLGDNPATGPILGDNPSTPIVYDVDGVTVLSGLETDFVISDGIETNFVLNNINDVLVGTNDYDDLIVGYDGNDDISGRQGNDWMYGGQGADSIFGGDGNDNIIGGTQADLLQGDAGADRFTYSRFNESQNSSRDRIVNFSATELDVIDVSELCSSLGITAPSFNSSLTYGSEGAVYTKVKGKTTASNVATKGTFWLGDDGVLYGNLDNNTGADLAVALVTPNIDATTGDVIGYNPITSADAGSLRTSAGTWLDFTV